MNENENYIFGADSGTAPIEVIVAIVAVVAIDWIRGLILCEDEGDEGGNIAHVEDGVGFYIGSGPTHYMPQLQLSTNTTLSFNL